MCPSYDILVIDLDGTLLTSDGEVTLRNRQAVSRARESGLQVIIATGRALKESRAAIDALGHEGLVVAAGGSVLCDAATGRTIDRRALSADVIAEVANPLLEDGHKVLILKDAPVAGYDYVAVGNGEFDPASQWWFQHLGMDVRHIDSLEQDPHPNDSLRAGAVASEDRLAPLAQFIKQSMGDRCSLQHWSAVTATHATGSPTHLLEVFTANVNKWTMIQGHCQRVGVAASRVAAIGDGLNDVELIQYAGLGVAMANSDPKVLVVADHVTTDHNADGVAYAIDQILAGAW